MLHQRAEAQRVGADRVLKRCTSPSCAARLLARVLRDRALVKRHELLRHMRTHVIVLAREPREVLRANVHMHAAVLAEGSAGFVLR